ncbi:MAG: hypothetical protein ACREKR_12570 [Candidatus Methylomirabilales bacterium]
MEKLFPSHQRSRPEQEDERTFPPNTLVNPEALLDLPPYWQRIAMGRHLKGAIRAEVARIFYTYPNYSDRDRELRRQCPFTPGTPLRKLWSKARKCENERWKEARRAGRHLQPALPGMDRFDWEDGNE